MATGSSLLLADDSITIQKVINLTFADEGMTVTTVGNGDLAMTKIEELSPDIVMLDVHMPGLNGYEICERLKQSDRFRHIPVILLVGSFEPFDEDEARRVGADDFLTKPFQSIRQLINKVGTLLNERPTAALSDPIPVAAEGDDAVMEYEVAPGQDLPGTRNVVGHGPGVVTHTEPLASAPDTFAGNRADYTTDQGLDDELIEARPFTGEVVQHDTFTGATRATRPLSALEVDDFGYGVSTGLANQASELAGSRDSAYAEPVDDSILELGEVSGASYGDDDPVLDLGESNEAVVSEMASLDQADGGVGSAALHDTIEDKIPAEYLEPEIEAAPAVELDAEQPVMVEAETFEPEPVVASVTPPAETAPAMISSASQLSPEMIDAIARRVVELMSDQAVREIAWEVVPQLADLHIKKKLDENR